MFKLQKNFLKTLLFRKGPHSFSIIGKFGINKELAPYLIMKGKKTRYYKEKK